MQHYAPCALFEFIYEIHINTYLHLFLYIVYKRLPLSVFYSSATDLIILSVVTKKVTIFQS